MRLRSDGLSSDSDIDVVDDSAVMSVKTVKLPEFWPESAALWFCRAEQEFALKSVTVDATKYSYLVSALPQVVANRVADELLDPDSTAPYAVLKKRLLKTFTPSSFQRGEQLLALPPSPAEQPTVLMDRMLAMLPDGVPRKNPGFLFRTLFLQKISPEVRAHVVGLEDVPMRELAEAADVVWTTSRAAAVAAVMPPPPAAECDDAASVYSSAVSQLGSLSLAPVSSVSAVGRPVPPPAAAAAAHGAYAVPAAAYCYYHETWGSKAEKCRDPCSWKPRQRSGNGRRGRR